MTISNKSKSFFPGALLIFFAAGVILLEAGCSSGPRQPTPKPLNVEIKGSPEAVGLTIQVYVATAYTPYNKDVLMEGPVDKLIDDPHSGLKIYPLTSTPILIKKNDLIWKEGSRTKRADSLVVIANLPKNFGGAGPPEKRRVVIPLDSYLWKNLPDKTVHIEIRENEVKLLDSPGY